MTARNLFDLLRPAIEASPGSLAIVAPDGQEITYRRLGETIAHFAREARSRGVAAGQRIAISITHPAATICMVVALSRLGATAAMGDRARNMIQAGVKLDGIISDSLDFDSGPGAIRFDQSWAAGAGEDIEISDEAIRSPADVAIICASSGSTGERKFFALTFETQIARLTLQDKMHGTQHPRRLITPGMSALWGFQNGFRSLRSGGLLIFPGRNAAHTMAEVERLAIEEIMTTPNLLVDLVNARADDQVLPGLRKIIVGGSQVSGTLLERARRKLCPEVVIAYGATETGPTVLGDAADVIADPDAVGRIAPWAEMRILSPEGQVLSSGESGRLQIRVTSQYRPETMISHGSTASPYDAEGWFEPGDVGQIEDGMLFLAGRTSDLINVGGNKLSAHALEEFASKSPGVTQAAITSHRNEAGFDTVCVALVTQAGFMLAQFDDKFSRRIGRITPRRYLLLDTLPLLTTGKIDKQMLKTLFATVRDHGSRVLSG
ncbi:acyl--CoA ligase [Nordella sp. HKS 07]|uniref:class I adenylate-forming enzyme family protein n=1 Tax=Nordella sp. HKS 07 TaxID=2712222 RepID=UPI0013E156A0|nr:class I adenylate-forming enzyme family protein [Nordella sp. HKS 07]QIG48481.1 acyl--CoA ligase [Nordella sp. HKS 07]